MFSYVKNTAVARVNCCFNCCFCIDVLALFRTLYANTPGGYSYSNVVKFRTKKSVQLENLFIKNAYAATNEWIKFKFKKTLNLYKTVNLLKTFSLQKAFNT